METRSAIEYDHTLEVRFGDLDPYGHLNSAQYLDLVNTSRLVFMEKTMGTKTTDLIQRHVGFYLAKATQEFLRPVPGMVNVRVQSFVAKVEAGRLFIPYTITNPETQKAYARGELEFQTVDLRTQRKMDLPPDLDFLFFREAPRVD